MACRRSHHRAQHDDDLIREDLAALGVSREHFFYERTLIFQEELGPTRSISSPEPSMAERAQSVSKAACRRRGARRSRTGRTANRLCSARRQFGDDVDRPLIKSDGSLHLFCHPISPITPTRSTRGFRTLIDVWGADHAGYIKRHAGSGQGPCALEQQGRSARGKIVHAKVVQLVKLMRAGQPVTMSKRAGSS